MQRVQIGLTGLVGVILLVGLANIVVDKAQTNAGPADQANAVNAAGGNSVAGPTDPLAEMGATPTADAPVVQDLQPDPALRRRMDGDPQPRPR